jgi:hypothetical protein
MLAFDEEKSFITLKPEELWCCEGEGERASGNWQIPGRLNIYWLMV